MKATGVFNIKEWDEERYEELGEEASLSRANVTMTFSGDIEGEGAVVYLMAYENASSARFVGQQRVTGTLGGREGSFVLHLSGNFDGSEARAEWDVVPGSATGELAGLRGSGSFAAPLGTSAKYTLEYDVE